MSSSRARCLLHFVENMSRNKTQQPLNPEILTSINTLLIACIKEKPCLYNSNLREYTRRDLTEKAWKQVSKEVKLTVVECKEKWKNLRYGLSRSLKQHSNGTSKKKYYLHDEMYFIMPYIKARPWRNSSRDTEMDDENNEEKESDEDLSEDEQSPLHEAVKEEIFEFDDSNESPMVDIHSCNDTVNSSIVIQQPASTNNNCNDDSRRMFLLSLLPEVQELTDKQMKSFKRKVLLLLDNIIEESREGHE